MALAWDRFGAPGLVALKLGVLWGMVAVILSHLRRRHLPLAGAAIVIVMGWWLVLPWTTAFRPQVFTYLGCALVLSLVARAEDGDYAALWWAVPLLPSGPTCTADSLPASPFSGSGPPHTWPVACGGTDGGTGLPRMPSDRRAFRILAAIAATAITPYGPQLWVFLRTALEPRAEIAEWNPIAVTSLEGAGPLRHPPSSHGWVVGIRASSPRRPGGCIHLRGCRPVRRPPTHAAVRGRRHDAGRRTYGGRRPTTRCATVRGSVGDERPRASVSSSGLRIGWRSVPHSSRSRRSPISAPSQVRPWDVPVAPVRWLSQTPVTATW